jgi:hypothetical protein
LRAAEHKRKDIIDRHGHEGCARLLAKGGKQQQPDTTNKKTSTTIHNDSIRAKKEYESTIEDLLKDWEPSPKPKPEKNIRGKTKEYHNIIQSALIDWEFSPSPPRSPNCVRTMGIEWESAARDSLEPTPPPPPRASWPPPSGVRKMALTKSPKPRRKQLQKDPPQWASSSKARSPFNIRRTRLAIKSSPRSRPKRLSLPDTTTTTNSTTNSNNSTTNTTIDEPKLAKHAWCWNLERTPDFLRRAFASEKSNF